MIYYCVCHVLCTRARTSSQAMGGCPLPKSGWLIPPSVAPRILPKLGPWRLLDAGLLEHSSSRLWQVTAGYCWITWTSLNPQPKKLKPWISLNAFFEWTSMDMFCAHLDAVPWQPRFSGAFDIYCFASAKKLTKWAAAFDRGRAHVVMQCDSVQSLQRILGTFAVRTKEVTWVNRELWWILYT